MMKMHKHIDKLLDIAIVTYGTEEKYNDLTIRYIAIKNRLDADKLDSYDLNEIKKLYKKFDANSFSKKDIKQIEEEFKEVEESIIKARN